VVQDDLHRVGASDERGGVRVSEEPQAGPVVKVARDLTEILRMYAELREQAVNEATSQLMPGGRAMVELGPVANLESWTHQQDTTERLIDHPQERLRRAYTSEPDEDPDEAWSAFQLIEFWSEAWRREHGAEYDQRPTIESEVNFVRYLLDWAWDNEPAWDDFAGDVRRARVRLEDVLTEGHRVEKTRVLCNLGACEEPRHLIRLVSASGREDVWKCPGCKGRYDRDDFRRAYADMLRSSGAERYIALSDAVSTLVAQGRGERTVRRWIVSEEVEAYCDPETRRTFVYWPDLWRLHLTTRRNPQRAQT